MKADRQHAIAPVDSIANVIRSLRGQRVILDSDLARLYGVLTKRLNEQFRRNRRRFPDDFAFRLTAEDVARALARLRLRAWSFEPFWCLVFGPWSFSGAWRLGLGAS